MTLENKMERQDADIKKMAKALREGARMLDLACPVCNNPIFQAKSGEMMCVACERQVVLEGEGQKRKEENATTSINEDTSQKGKPGETTVVQADGASRSSRAILLVLKERSIEKLASLVKKMGGIADENELSLVYSNILKLLEILRHLSLE